MPRHHVLLLPGLLTDARLYAHQCGALADIADVSVGDLTRDDSVAALAERLLASAPSRFALAGLSMGGYIALEILRRAPERIERLALLDTTARPDTPEQSQRRDASIALARAGRFGEIMPALLPLLVHPDHLALEAIGGLALRMADSVGADAFIRQQTAIRDRPDSRPSLPAISCPTLVLVGAQDQLTPPDRAAEMVAAIPGARQITIPDCGHLSAIERPEAVSEALRSWLLG